MKACQFAELLNNNPEAEVLILFNSLPFPVEPNNVAMNNEANAWIIQIPLFNLPRKPPPVSADRGNQQ
jgi:hypothetical protein